MTTNSSCRPKAPLRRALIPRLSSAICAPAPLGLLLLFIAQAPSACAATPFGIDGIRLQNGSVSITYPANGGSYYILYRGSINSITNPVSAALGERSADGLGSLTAETIGTGPQFFVAREVPVQQPFDLDADGIDDVYELRRSAMLNPLNKLDAALPDSDGRTFLQHYLADKDAPQTIFVPTLKGRFSTGTLSALITAQGELWTWGGPLAGNGTEGNKESAVRIGTDTDWIAVSAGATHALALKNDHSLWVWGNNEHGQLGIPEVSKLPAPVKLGLGNDWSIISAGGGHSMAIKRDGSLWGWGQNTVLQAGLTDRADIRTPRQVGADLDWVDVAAGGAHSLGVKKDGRLWAFPKSLPITNPSGGLAGQLGTVLGWSRISAGVNVSAVVASDGTLWLSKAGIGLNSDYQSTPIQAGLDNDWVSASALYSSPVPIGVDAVALAVRRNGSLWAVGNSGSVAQLGTETSWIETGGLVAAKRDGTLHLLGGGYARETVNLLAKPADIPIRIGIDKGWEKILSDGRVFRKDGTLWAIPFGSESAHPTKIGSQDDYWSKIVSGFGLKNDGTLWVFDGSLPPVRVGDELWRDIGSGLLYPKGIKHDGTLWEWRSSVIPEDKLPASEQIFSECFLAERSTNRICYGFSPYQIVREEIIVVRPTGATTRVTNLDGTITSAMLYTTNYHCCQTTNDYVIITNSPAVYDGLGNVLKPAVLSISPDDCIKGTTPLPDQAEWHLAGWDFLDFGSAVGAAGDLWLWDFGGPPWNFGDPPSRYQPLHLDLQEPVKKVLQVGITEGLALLRSGMLRRWEFRPDGSLNIQSIAPEMKWEDVTPNLLGLSESGEIWSISLDRSPMQIGRDKDWKGLTDSLAIKADGSLFELYSSNDSDTPNVRPVVIVPTPQPLNVGVSLRCDLLSDLNNDGKIDATDDYVRNRAFRSGAERVDIEAGTEYFFVNDTISNGLWDKEDFSARPGKLHTDDDDIQEFAVSVSAKVGVVWFEHPKLQNVAFYSARSCEPGDRLAFPVNLEQTFLPSRIFLRMVGEISDEITDDLTLVWGKADKSELFGSARVRITAVNAIGNEHFFHGARDYMFENNTRLFVRQKRYADAEFRVVCMLGEKTTMSAINASKGSSPLKGIDAIAAAYPQSLVIINGNFCFFSNDYYNSELGSLQAGTLGLITDRCHGRLVTGRLLDDVVSSDSTDKMSKPEGSELAGNRGNYVAQVAGAFTFAYGQVPLAVFDEALGGFSTDYSEVQREYVANQVLGRVFVPGSDMIFTASQSQQNPGRLTAFVADARRSGVAQLPGAPEDRLQLMILDGNTSVALAHEDPDGELTTYYKGGKHTGVPHYYIGTYLIFRASNPR